MNKLPWLGLLVVFLMACGLSAPAATATAGSGGTPLALPQNTAVTPQPPTASPSPLPSETVTSPAPTIPPLLTSIPGIAATLTAVASTPGAEATLVAQQTMMAATEAVQLGGLSGTLLGQCPDPSDPPKTEWLNVPVMPQATAGQVVQTLIGSYYCFRAPVSVGDVEAYYKDKLSPPNWVLQSDVNGSMVFIGLSLTGAQILFLDTGPGNKNDLVVAINVTVPMAIPTPKK